MNIIWRGTRSCSEMSPEFVWKLWKNVRFPDMFIILWVFGLGGVTYFLVTFSFFISKCISRNIRNISYKHLLFMENLYEVTWVLYRISNLLPPHLYWIKLKESCLRSLNNFSKLFLQFFPICNVFLEIIVHSRTSSPPYIALVFRAQESEISL